MLEWNAGMEWWNRTTLTSESSTSLSITIGLLDVPSPFDNITSGSFNSPTTLEQCFEPHKNTLKQVTRS